jgi:hypothetical protein
MRSRYVGLFVDIAAARAWAIADGLDPEAAIELENYDPASVHSALMDFIWEHWQRTHGCNGSEAAHALVKEFEQFAKAVDERFDPRDTEGQQLAPS